MHKISPLIGPLRGTPPIIGSEEERARREYTVQMSKRALIHLCQQEASKFLVQGCYDLAVPGAIQVNFGLYFPSAVVCEIHEDRSTSSINSGLFMATNGESLVDFEGLAMHP